MLSSFSTFIRTNRGKQLQALAQLALIIYIIKRYSKPVQRHSSIDLTNEYTTPVKYTNGTNGVKKIGQLNGINVTTNSHHNTHLSLFQRYKQSIIATLIDYNKRLNKYDAWTLILGTLGIVHLVNKWSLLMGMSPPSSSLITEPDMNYSPNFQQTRVFLTAFDAAVLSSLRLKPAILRHCVSFVLLFWYLVFNTRAEHKVEAFRRSLSVRYVRAMWTKGEHPILHWLGSLIAKRAKIHMHRLDVAGIECYLFYNKPLNQLQNEDKLILDFPGGGFVSMEPQHHADYLSQIAIKTNVPLLTVAYRKAPESPYPSAVNDCYAVYKEIVQSNGHCIDMHTNIFKSFDSNDNELRIALLGDSAGGNLVMSVTYHALVDGIRVPNGCHLIYPALDLSTEIWRSAYEQLNQKYDNTNVKHTAIETTQPKSHVQHTHDNNNVIKFNPFGEDVTNNNPNRPIMTSKALYAFDGVLPMRYMILIGQAYFRNGGDPVNDYFASPLRAPASLLNELPPVYIHCGDVDPLSDDSVFFIDRIKYVNPNIKTRLELIPGVSHAYMQITSLLPEGKHALRTTCDWLTELLAMPTKPAIKVHVPIPNSIPPDIKHTQHCTEDEIDRVAGQKKAQVECNDVGDKHPTAQPPTTTVQSKL